jgi:hypothetical protein
VEQQLVLTQAALQFFRGDRRARLRVPGEQPRERAHHERSFERAGDLEREVLGNALGVGELAKVAAGEEHDLGGGFRRLEQVQRVDRVDARCLEVDHDGERGGNHQLGETLERVRHLPLLDDRGARAMDRIEKLVVVGDDDDAIALGAHR